MPPLSYYPQGAFAYVGAAGTEYYFQYANVGSYFPADADFANASVYFHHYGLHEYTLQPWPLNYYFSLVAESYNVAGLRYNGVWVYLNGNGYSYAPGQGYHTAWTFAPSNLLELSQAVETPVFRVTDYWFGPWNNFPQDTKLPQPQNTRSLTGGGFLLYPIHQWGLSTVWAKEGVYRPGYTYQPGYSAPRLHTYMQTYFEHAYRADPTTGELPRSSVINWDGRGFINDSVAQPTGQIDTAGYYFRPNQFGKAVMTTRAQESGFYGEIPVYTLGLLVDKNRDGLLTTNDVTTVQNPHVFWVNNDADRRVYEVSPNNGADELDLRPGENNNGTDVDFIRARQYVPSPRDLEDYDRLHVPGLKELARDLPSGSTVTLKWKQVFSGSPGIFVIRASEGDGGKLYLTELEAAEYQARTIEGVLNGVTTHYSPYIVGEVSVGTSAYLHTDAKRATNQFYLYCGTGRGSGELAVEIHRDGQLLGSVSTYLDLRDVKELYERWTAGEPATWQGSTPSTNATLHGGNLPSGVPTTAFTSDNPNQPYILFVHGWNMAGDEKDMFAETAFKRLYWQGYTNRFGAFRWPTGHTFPSPASVTTDLLEHYNRSELYAWKSGEGLRKLLVSLNSRYPNKVYMMAHSMGNVVAGEALALQAEKHGGGQIVRTYVASQAAVSLHAYNGNNNNTAFKLDFQRAPFRAFP